MRNPNVRRCFALLLLAILIAAGIAVLCREDAAMASLRNVSMLPLLALFVLQSFFSLGNGLILRSLARTFGIALSATEWMGLPLVTSMGNYLTPFSGGMIARAAYLNRRHGLSMVRFGMILSMNAVLHFWLAGIMGSAVLVTLSLDPTDFSLLLLCFVSIAAVASALLFLPWTNLPTAGRYGIFFRQAFEGWSILRMDRPVLARISLYMTGNILLGAIMSFLAFRALGAEAAFASVFIASLLSGFTVVFNLTPGNLGIQEAVFSITAGFLNLGFETGLLAALMVRTVAMVHTFTLGPVAGSLLAGGFHPWKTAPASSEHMEKSGGSHP